MIVVSHESHDMYNPIFVLINPFLYQKKIKNLIICINTGTLSNMNENTKEIYH